MSAPTIREIAKASGYNNSTVSRALSNKPTIPAATKSKILSIARNMGWKPNPMASAYMAHLRSTQKPKYQATLAYVLTDENITESSETKHIQLHLKGARQRADHFGYMVEPFWLRDYDYNLAGLFRMLKNRGIPGMVLPNSKPLRSDKRSVPPDWDSFALATSGYSISEPLLHRSAFYWPHGMRMVLDKIRDYGYRDVALITMEAFDRVTDSAFTAPFYYREKHYRPKEIFRSFIVPEETSDVVDVIQQWLISNRPEVVIGTREVWLALEKMQWEVPGDIAFVSPHWSSPWPHIAGIDQIWQMTGANAVDLVVTQLNANERGIPKVAQLLLNEGVWVDGKSMPRRLKLSDTTA